MIDEPSSDGALHLVDTTIERLSILDQRSELAMSFRRHVNGFKLIHRSHASKLESVILVGLAFDIGPRPGIFIGGTNQRLEAMALGEVIDPTGWPASFHDNKIELMLLEDGGKIISFSRCIEESMFAILCVKKAAHGIERCYLTGPRSRARIFKVTFVLRVWGWNFVTRCVCAQR